MPTNYTQIYHSPIGVIKIVADDFCIEELVFIEDTQLKQLTISTTTPDVINQCIDELIEYFAGKRKHFSVAINQAGTEFQQKVWKELYEVPFSKTLSYGELAKKMGDPNLVRAAASANGKNKIAIIVPCHRIVGADRSLVGYAWGKARKKWLLQHEFRLELGVQTLF
ncbi:MAG: methylated-DNA--[protein]-cysteine S-methyltransferase [Chitinophagia bacterium]|jgi:methylated-DNA-[protein]-cysteine S-methyltransferase